MQSPIIEKNHTHFFLNPARLLKFLLFFLSSCCILAIFLTDNTRKTEIPARVAASLVAEPEQQFSGNTPLNGYATQSVSQLVDDALAFKGLLNATQLSALQLTYTTSLARKWSNLPCGASCRNGVQFGTLNASQVAAAYQVIKDALGTGASDGANEFHQLSLAEAYLHANGGGSGYDSTLRWIAFLNVPSKTNAWMLQFGGHHYAANIAFNNGHVIGATPFFMGVEPKVFTWNGTTYSPLTDERDAFANLLASLSSTELATAKLSATFSDCSMIPGESNGGNGTFPATKVGVPCSALSQAQKDLVIAVMNHYVGDMDSETAAAVMQEYTSEINDTYIAYTGNGTSGSATSFLLSSSNYARIDGPHVWIEFCCQNGVVVQGQIHYHTVWRDHSHDYGVDLTGPAIDESASSATLELNRMDALSIAPNPAAGIVTVKLPFSAKDAEVAVIQAATGQAVRVLHNITGKDFNFDSTALPAGAYIMRVRESNKVYSGKFTKW